MPCRASALLSIKIVFKGCAITTARSRLLQSAIEAPVYSDEFNFLWLNPPS